VQNQSQRPATSSSCIPFHQLSHEDQTRHLFQKITMTMFFWIRTCLWHSLPKANSYIFIVINIFPSERSRVCGMSESSTSTINQAYLLHRKNNSCCAESKLLYVMSHLEQWFSEAFLTKMKHLLHTASMLTEHPGGKRLWPLLFLVYSFSFLLL
jgi:hypothetical protein